MDEHNINGNYAAQMRQNSFFFDAVETRLCECPNGIGLLVTMPQNMWHWFRHYNRQEIIADCWDIAAAIPQVAHLEFPHILHYTLRVLFEDAMGLPSTGSDQLRDARIEAFPREYPEHYQ